MRTGIVTFAFGEPASTSSNQELAEITIRLAREKGAPVFTQNDIQLPESWSVFRTRQGKHEGPPPTLRIARTAIEWAKLGGLNELLVVAAKPHIWRAERDMRKAVQEAGADIKVKPFTILTVDWYDSASAQKRVRSRLAWWPREILLRLMPFSLYKRVAS